MNIDLIIPLLLDAGQYSTIYLLASESAQIKLSWNNCLWYVLFWVMVDIIEMIILPTYGFLSVLYSFIAVAVHSYLIFHIRGKKLILSTAIQLIAINLGAGLCAVSNTLAFGFEYVAEVAATMTFKPAPIALVNMATIITEWYILRGVLSLIRREQWNSPDWLPLARAVIILIASIAATIILLKDFSTYNPEEKLAQVILTFMLVSVMMMAVIGSLLQEVRNLQLKRWGETLEKEKQTTDALVKDLRVFRHNIINTLHGFRGVIASGNTQEQLAYYESLAGDLRRLNNENVLALQQLRSPALSALLMEKLNETGKKELPVYLYTKGSPVIRGPEEKLLCAAAGAVIDNAVEAALESEAGNVRIQIAQENGETSLTVMNTFPDSLDVEAFLTGKNASTKEGHTGLGLGFVEETVRKNPKMSFFRRQHGRYIECVLICSE